MKAKSPVFALVVVCLAGTLAGLAQEAPAGARLSGVTSSNNNPLQIAILHWYNANLTTSFSVGTTPQGVAFDGASMGHEQRRQRRDQARGQRRLEPGNFQCGQRPFWRGF